MMSPDGGASAMASSHATSEAIVFPDRTAPCHRLMRAVARATLRSCLRDRGKVSRSSTRSPPVGVPLGLVVAERLAQSAGQVAEHGTDLAGRVAGVDLRQPRR